ncbi:UDP-2,4-diacetamido-2,4,6-trideoxy-beta-L-altropyranose hydrolase [Desulfovibrio cuneatus]|uniref:UDP-2,4-diacetamido-2,4, 6-trideoxy-beta-L-altropyranose hydrolase n=1 Tax=Desulfovibrio cuneatus TaxID=159728 RepID=UPI00040AF144|nr:UDP-2,4-diacetamido-2,4,6-trideoxy-beta-L-altropyranose hydrolase [Desulfovibrio cuneatus]
MVVIRADATPTMGTGHVMRCIALAQAAKSSGLAVCLVGHITVPWVLERLKSEAIAFTLQDGPPPAQESPAKLLQDLASCGAQNWVALDGYHIGPDCHKAVREAGYKLLVIDDYAHLPEYSCDILLNQNIGAEELAYTGNIGQKLLGPRFALLRNEFLEARKKALQRPVPEKATEVLLTLGGGDFSHILPQLAPAFSSPELAGCTLRVIAGVMQEKAIRTALHQCPANIVVLPRVENMPQLFLQTDVCITAGGSTCWELCCLGVPFLTVQVAENQALVVQNLEQKKVALTLCEKNLTDLIVSQHKQIVQRKNNQSTVDGKGASRVLGQMIQQQIELRPVSETDMNALYTIANNPAVRSLFFSPQQISLMEHKLWFENRLSKREEEPFYLATLKDSQTVLGYVRFDKKNNNFFVSIALDPRWQKLGLSGHILNAGCTKVKKLFNQCCFYAWCHKDNDASKSIFFNLGFEKCTRPHETKRDFILLKKA